MAKLPILIAPDPRLKKVSKPVAAVDGKIRKLMDDMLETMYQAPGIGLAAPQVGKLVRVIVLDVTPEGEEKHPYRLVNPEYPEGRLFDVDPGPRRNHQIRLEDLVKLRVSLTKCRPFVVVADHNPDAMRVDHGDLRQRVAPGNQQLELFAASTTARSGEI